MKVIFICTGNTCRSPMAEGYLKSLRLPGVTVQSRGLYPGGDPVSDNSVSVMQEIGIDIKNHVSKQLSADDTNADLFICATSSHKEVLQSAGIDKEKIIVLGSGISDPFMKGENAYRKCRDEIISSVDTLLFDGVILPYRIVSANQSDIKDIAALEKECFSLPWSENAVYESMNASTLFFTAICGDKTVGYAGVSFAADCWYVTNVAVTKDFRGKGIGSLLVLRIIREAQQQNAQFVSLEVRVSNDKAINMYKKLGFVKEGLRKNFYSSPREDAEILTRRFFNADTGN